MPGMLPTPEPLVPACVAKLGHQIGCFDPTSGHVFAIHMITPSHSAQFWSWIETIPWEHDILLITDDPGLKEAIIKNTQRLNIVDFCPNFQPGFPYECFPPMMMALNAISLVRTLKFVDEVKEKASCQITL